MPVQRHKCRVNTQAVQWVTALHSAEPADRQHLAHE